MGFNCIGSWSLSFNLLYMSDSTFDPHIDLTCLRHAYNGKNKY